MERLPEIAKVAILELADGQRRRPFHQPDCIGAVLRSHPVVEGQNLIPGNTSRGTTKDTAQAQAVAATRENPLGSASAGTDEELLILFQGGGFTDAPGQVLFNVEGSILDAVAAQPGFSHHGMHRDDLRAKRQVRGDIGQIHFRSPGGAHSGGVAAVTAFDHRIFDPIPAGGIHGGTAADNGQTLDAFDHAGLEIDRGGEATQAVNAFPHRRLGALHAVEAVDQGALDHAGC